MKTACKFALLVLAAFCLAASGYGGAQQPAPERLHLHLDPSATEIHYTLKDTIHTVQGTFHLKSGEISFDTHSGAAQGVISVETASGASGNDTRDGKMKREYLEAPRFPLATFEPQKVTGFNPAADTQKITVEGSLTLHGSPHPMTLEFEVRHSGTQITATTHFPIPFVAWGIKDPSNMFVKVEKEVGIDLIAKGTLTPEQ